MSDNSSMELSQEDTVPTASPVPGGKAGIPRRVFLGAGLAGTLLVAVGSRFLSGEQATVEATSDYALILDLDKCVGCRACEQACTERNQLPEGQSFIHILPKGDSDSRWFLPIQCQHCQDAPCISVCPAGATYRHPSGVILVDETVCVGCKYCVVACPYNARIYEEHAGVALKCWLCLDRVLGGGAPACVDACVTGTRIFGRRSDPVIARLLESGRVQLLHPELGTKPGVLAYDFPDA